jgi:predicted nucleic acid-binding protein
MSVYEIQFTPGIVLPESLYIDSNVLIAFFDKNHQTHQKASQLLLEAKASNVNIYISSLVQNASLVCVNAKLATARIRY